jgi:hypothetical protein
MDEYLKAKPLLCNPGNFYQSFSPVLESIWQFWEIMVIGESCLIIADNPASSSQIIQSLVELMKPVGHFS